MKEKLLKQNMKNIFGNYSKQLRKKPFIKNHDLKRITSTFNIKS